MKPSHENIIKKLNDEWQALNLTKNYWNIIRLPNDNQRNKNLQSIVSSNERCVSVYVFR